MTPKQSKKELSNRLEGGGKELAAVTPADGVAAMLAFYADERAEGCEIDEDGDMLLYQWGVYEVGRGETFQLDITRQFMPADEDEPYQLSLTFHFEPSAALRRIGDGNRWCGEPKGVAKFRKFIEGSAAYRAVAAEKPKKVELTYGGC